jgi:hypothetical protein
MLDTLKSDSEFRFITKLKSSLSKNSNNLLTTPSTLDLRPWLPPVITNPVGTCNCVWVVLLMIEYNSIKNCKYNKPLSSLFLTKNIMPSNKGSYAFYGLIEGAIKYGTVPEEVYPSFVDITPDMYKLALNFKIDSYIEIDSKSIDEMKIALTNYGPCVIFYEHFNLSKYPWIPVAECKGNQFTHPISVVGYTNDSFILRNTWGADWADKGYTYMPFTDYTKYSLKAYYATFLNNINIPKLDTIIPTPLNNTSIIISSLIGGIILLYFIFYIFYKGLYKLPIFNVIFHYGKYASDLIFFGLLIITTLFMYNLKGLNNVFIVNLSVILIYIFAILTNLNINNYMKFI